MELKYDEYEELNDNKNNFIICKTEDSKINDYICLNNCIYKISKIHLIFTRKTWIF